MIKHEYTDQNLAEGRPADYMCGCPKGELLGPCEHADLPASMTRVGSGIYLTPSDAAMTPEHLTAWFRMRGVADEQWLAELLTQYAGKTEDEMDRIYENHHGSMA